MTACRTFRSLLLAALVLGLSTTGMQCIFTGQLRNRTGDTLELRMSGVDLSLLASEWNGELAAARFVTELDTAGRTAILRLPADSAIIIGFGHNRSYADREPPFRARRSSLFESVVISGRSYPTRTLADSMIITLPMSRLGSYLHEFAIEGQ